MGESLVTRRGGSTGIALKSCKAFKIIRKASGGVPVSVANYKVVLFSAGIAAYFPEKNIVCDRPTSMNDTKTNVTKITAKTTISGTIIDPINKTVHTTSSDFVYCHAYS